MRHIGNRGMGLIREYEGFSAVPYICPAGYQTIGYGHVIKNHEHFTEITKTYADGLLISDLSLAERAVARLINATLSDGQFDSLVSFTFNLGPAALQRSGLRRKVNNGYCEEDIIPEFLKWIYVGGRKLPGLVKRRREESRLFIS